MIQLQAPAQPISTSVTLGGSKSISNRLLLLKHLGDLQIDLQNLSPAEDTSLLQKALEQVKTGNTTVIDVHHAGTDLRFLTALLAVTPGQWTLTGSARLKQRPVGDLVEALKTLGANIQYLEQKGFAPLQIHGKTFNGGQLQVNSSVSSQFISALLLIAPTLDKGLDLQLQGETVSWPYIQMTMDLLKAFGVQVSYDKKHIRVEPSKLQYAKPAFTVESDWSSASYWYSICALSPNARISLKYLSQKSWQADAVLPQLFDELGVSTAFTNDGLILMNKPITAKGFEYDFTNCPDIAQTLAATCFGLGLPARLTGLKTLKIKETDRITALKTELEKLGAKVTAGLDILAIAGNQELGIQNKERVHSDSLKQGTRNQEQIHDDSLKLDTYHDHRMAMSLAPLCLLGQPLLINDPGVVNKSYPGFWQDLKSAGFNVNLQP